MTTITIPAGHACANQGTSCTAGSSVVRYILKYVRRSMRPEALRPAAGSSGKDGFTALAHSDRIQKLLAQIEGFQERYQPHELSEAIGNEVPVDLTRFIAKADHSVLTASVPFNMALGSNHGHDELVVNAWSYPLQELCLHSCLYGLDVVLLHCAARPLRKTIRYRQVAEMPVHAAQEQLVPRTLKDEVCNRLNAIKRRLEVGFDRVAFPPQVACHASNSSDSTLSLLWVPKAFFLSCSKASLASATACS